MSKSKPSPVDLVPPSKTRTPAEVDAILAAHEASEAAAQAEAELAALARTYDALKRQAREVEAEIERTRKAILARTSDAVGESPAAEFRVIVGRMPTQRRFNLADFVADNPDHADWIDQWFDDAPGAVSVRVFDRK